MSGRRLLAAVAAAAALVAAALGAGVPAGPARAASADGRPNVIVVMTDDQTVAQLTPRAMPKTVAAFAAGGTKFTDSVVSSPLCCPSRAGLLTGSYAHNNGVYDNTPGYPALADPSQTLFTWLKEAGYRTGHVGRYLLNYSESPGTLGGALAPPGVDDWFGYLDGATNYYNGLFSDNGLTLRAGYDPVRSYSTNIINREATDFVADNASSGKPFFLWAAQIAPHTSNAGIHDGCGGGTPQTPPGVFSAFAHEPLPRSKSFDEEAIRDKPNWVKARRRLSAEKKTLLKRGWRCALASLSVVDQGVADLVGQLASLGELDNTAIFFTSDNGLLFGEHRLVQQKSYPYEEVVRVPLLALVPPGYLGGATPPAEIDEPVTNLDLSATVLDLADAAPCTAAGCRGIDGRSLLPLMAGDSASWPAKRGTLIEIGNPSCTRDPTILNGLTTFYSAIRTPGFLYVELHHVDKATGLCDRTEYELYNLKRDPNQLENIAVNPARKKPSPVQRGLRARLATLRNCAGASGRDTPLPGRTLCE